MPLLCLLCLLHPDTALIFCLPCSNRNRVEHALAQEGVALDTCYMCYHPLCPLRWTRCRWAGRAILHYTTTHPAGSDLRSLGSSLSMTHIWMHKPQATRLHCIWRREWDISRLYGFWLTTERTWLSREWLARHLTRSLLRMDTAMLRNCCWNMARKG